MSLKHNPKHTKSPDKPSLVHRKKGDETPHEERHIIWDEKAIVEHDKLRGTRMKIEEPKTPYSQYKDDASDAGSEAAVAQPGNDVSMQWEHLHDKLSDVSELQQQGHDIVTKPSDESLEKKKHSDFLKHRKQHYNEFELAKKFAAEHADDEEDEEED